MDSSALWGQMIATVVGGALAIAGGFFAKLYSDRQERKSLKSAHAGELRAILELLNRRDYLNILKEHIASMKENLGEFSFFAVRASSDAYNRVFIATAPRLGMLPAPLPEQIVKLQYLMQSIFSDFALIADAEANPHGNNWLRKDAEECLRMHEELLVTMESARKLACELIDQLENGSVK